MSNVLDAYKDEYEYTPVRKLHIKRGSRISESERKRRRDILMKRRAERRASIKKKSRR